MSTTTVQILNKAPNFPYPYLIKIIRDPSLVSFGGLVRKKIHNYAFLVGAPQERNFFYNAGKLYIMESEILCRIKFTKENTSENQDFRI